MHHIIYQSLANGYCIGPVVPDDKSAFVEHLNDKRIYENTLRIPYPYTEGDADWWIQRRVLQPVSAKQTLFAIRNKEGYLIGIVDADSNTVGVQQRISEIGYWLASPYWGSGIMTEAIAWLCGYAFSELGLLRLTAHVFIFNRRSARVLEKNGFQMERVLPKHYLKDGVPIDACRYALVR